MRYLFKFLFKYNLKMNLAEKSGLFWLLIFPFALSTVLAFAIPSDSKIYNIKPVKVMVENVKYRNILDKIELKGKNLFEIKEYNNPKEALEADKIDGYVRSENGSDEVIIKKDTIESGLLYNTINYIKHNESAVMEIMREPQNRSKLNEIVNDISSGPEERISNAQSRKVDTKAVFFYGVMAMICMGSMTFGVIIAESNRTSSDMGYSKRINIAPIPKFRLIIGQFCAIYSISSVFTLILYVYIRYGLKIDFGGTQIQVIVGLLAGNLMSILIGIVLALLLKTKTNTKIAFSAAFYVFSSYLSGMMNNKIPAIINNYVPILNNINPGSVLSKMFTSLYLFDDGGKYLLYLSNIFIISVVMVILIAILSRRNSYDSI